ncbi:MAG TPA: HD domain-containing protein [Kineosporiaceae bacterium]|jgi:GTP pyrophosphokinase|nr:HD domain-containing protein [Kineosporiaceae bacterium]
MRLVMFHRGSSRPDPFAGDDRPGEAFDALRSAFGAGLAPGDVERLERVHAYVREAYEGQRRRSGDPYVTHCIGVAVLLAHWGRPLDTVLAGLLHDVTDVVPDLQGAREVAGERPIEFVAALPGVTSPGGVAMAASAPDNPFERDLLLVHLADRLHNARTWQYLPPDRARLKAAQTAAAHAPAAIALGLPAVAGELLERSIAQLAVPWPGGSTVTGARLFTRAVLLLPPRNRERYLVEWSADLAHLQTRRERLAFSAGLLHSALALRRYAARGG